jgi:hypothetical protein
LGYQGILESTTMKEIPAVNSVKLQRHTRPDCGTAAKARNGPRCLNLMMMMMMGTPNQTPTF